jgi:glutamine amidotransferase
MQLLLSESDEMGRFLGLDIIPGRVERFDFPNDPSLKIPHMGWNGLSFPEERSPLLAGLEEGVQVYFVHSYVCRPSDPSVVAATGTHGEPFCAALASGNVYATQFHPEKSGQAGLRILENFATL